MTTTSMTAKRRTLAKRLAGASALAMLAAGASPALAQQATPGSAQCPRTANVVNCTGNVGTGFRSDNDATMTELNFRNLTQPIAPASGQFVVNVRSHNDLNLNLDSGVIVNARLPSSPFIVTDQGVNVSPSSAVNLLFDRAQNSTATIANAGTVNANLEFAGRLAGAFFVRDARTVSFTNTGTINVDNFNPNARNNYAIDAHGVRIDGADSIQFRNDGRIATIGGSGTFGVDLVGRAVDFINRGTIETAGENGQPAFIIAQANGGQAASLSFANEGRITQIQQPVVFSFFFHNPISLYQIGTGRVDVLNTGPISGSEISINAIGQNSTDDTTINIVNSGLLTSSGISVTTGERFIFSGILPNLGPRGLISIGPIFAYRNTIVNLTNNGDLQGGTFAVRAGGQNVVITFVNTGNILAGGPAASSSDTDAGVLLFGLPTAGGSSTISVRNEGTIATSSDYHRYAIVIVEGSTASLINRGLISGTSGSIDSDSTLALTNESSGTLDGVLTLQSAGSSVSNAGAIRVSTAPFVAHEINGNFTQTATGVLNMRADAVGRDRMNATGNFLLNGTLNLQLAAPSASPVFTVGGNLTLDGLLNVTDAGGFGMGVYRLFNYGGGLTDNGLNIGSLPGTFSAAVQTAVAGQINLVVSAGVGPTPALQFWDGGDLAADNVVDGGTGTWTTTTTNWTRTNGDVNEAWGSQFAVFQGTPGTVTIAPGGVTATGLQFAVTGYRLEGATLTMLTPATLRVGDGSMAGAGYTATIASAIAGVGGIDKTDLGTLILSGTNTYSGGTRVSGGVLQIASDANLGAAAGGVTLDGGTLRAGGALTSARGFTFGAGGSTLDFGANAVTLSGLLGGSGALTFTGSNTLTLSGNSAARTGATRIAGGTLSLSGSLGGPLTIASGATLTGTGTTGNLIVEGRVAPGNSPGTLSVNGNISFAAGSTYAVELAASGAGDRINATGTATLNGGTVAITALDPDLSYTNGATYRILNATGGRTGTFAGLTESSAFLDFALAYDATGVNVNVAVVRTFPEVAQTFNQAQAATGLRDLRQTGGSDSLGVYQNILLLDAAPARAAFDAASGEIYAVSLASAQRQGSALGGRLSARAFAATGEGWGIWGGPSGHDGSVSGDGNGGRYTHDAIGGDLGIDYRGKDGRWAAGLAGGKFTGNTVLASRASRADTNGWAIGGYLRAGTGHAGLSGVASFAYADANANHSRAIAFGTLARTASARTKVTTTTASLDLRYGIEVGKWALGPMIGIEHGSARLGAFTESGANALSLSGLGQTDKITRGTFGAFANLKSGQGTIDFSARYARGSQAPSEVALSLAGSPSLFRVRSAAGPKDALLLGLSGDYKLGSGWSLGGDVRGTFAQGAQTVAGSATLAFRF